MWFKEPNRYFCKTGNCTTNYERVLIALTRVTLPDEANRKEYIPRWGVSSSTPNRPSHPHPPPPPITPPPPPPPPTIHQHHPPTTTTHHPSFILIVLIDKTTNQWSIDIFAFYSVAILAQHEPNTRQVLRQHWLSKVYKEEQLFYGSKQIMQPSFFFCLSVCLPLCLSVCLSVVCHTFFTKFLSSYHHEIFMG